MSHAQTSARDYILAFFAARGPVPDDVSLLEYIREGLLDSLGLIGLIGSIESDLDVEFTTDDFEDARFKTIGGLIEMVEGKQRASHAQNI